MKKYYKNGQQVQRPTSIVYKGCTYVHPTDFILTKAGYEIVEKELPVKQHHLQSQSHITTYRM